MFRYIRDPAKITEQSLAIVRTETDLDRFPAAEADIVVRLVHACGEPSIARDIAGGGDWLEAGRAALLAGAPVLVDAHMVAAGINRDRLPQGNPVVCTLDDKRVRANTADFCPHGIQKMTEVLHMGFRGGKTNGGGATG